MMRKTVLSILTLAMMLVMTPALQAQYALKPADSYSSRPEDGDMKYEEIKITTEDAVELNAWVFPSTTPSNNWMLFSHSGVGNMGDYIEIIYRFSSKGYNVLAYDYRGFGASTAFRYKDNEYIKPQHVKDFNAAAGWIRKNKSSSFCLYGFGVGATLSLGLGIHRDDIKRIAADSPALTLEGIAAKGKEAGVTLVVPPFGYDKPNEPLYAVEGPIGKIFVGALLISGDKDKVVTPQDMVSLKAKLTKQLETYVVPGADIASTFSTDKDKYVNTILDFFNRK